MNNLNTKSKSPIEKQQQQLVINHGNGEMMAGQGHHVQQTVVGNNITTKGISQVQPKLILGQYGNSKNNI